MVQRLVYGVVVALLLALGPQAGAQNVDHIRLMLHPDAAAPGSLPLATMARLQALSGAALTVSGTTRTGALEFALAQPLSAGDADTLLRRLREDRSVLWAEPIVPNLAAKSSDLS